MIKAEVVDPRAETFSFSEQKTMYGGKHIAEGDTLYIFASENEDGLEDLSSLEDLLEAGDVTPVIDRTYRLDQAAEAIRYLEGGHAAGKVVLTV